MSEILQEIADVPKEFFKDGTQFINRCTKRTFSSPAPDRNALLQLSPPTEQQQQYQQGQTQSRAQDLAAVNLPFDSSAAHHRPFGIGHIPSSLFKTADC
ncbi:uncharacterized protein PV07_09892 [Cladophialophora immunda]|uniref:Uncharacterized protein n=1 Tax=Cladophialophora immunda TaxID=569365 RepID=A0A0D2AH18_9EURO|nr:uncharacterized protein PV07_09892 [Cladophialophora immunda]KIW24162.1 hypothetical protein PV07_09892 [Cladophialophora immunda]